MPLLALVAFLAPGGEETTLAARLVSVAIGLAAIGGLILAGRYLLDPLFRLLASAGAREVMTAAALLVVLGAALAMQTAGLSMAMGAFLAGVLLSESTFRHQLEADVEPFRGILLGLFFLGVGMALDLDVIAANAGLIAVSVVGFMILKMLGIYGVARLFRAGAREALERAVLMAQGGEFAFVLYAAATAVGIIGAEENAILTAIIIVSMALTPLLVMLHDRLAPAARAVDGRGRGGRGPDRVGAPHRLRPVRPDRQPAAARPRLLDLDHRDRHRDDPRRRRASASRSTTATARASTSCTPPAPATPQLIVCAVDDREAAVKIAETRQGRVPAGAAAGAVLRPRARGRARPCRRRLADPRDPRIGAGDRRGGAAPARRQRRGDRRRPWPTPAGATSSGSSSTWSAASTPARTCSSATSPAGRRLDRPVSGGRR